MKAIHHVDRLVTDLLIRSGDNVAHAPQCRHNDAGLISLQQLHQTGHCIRIDDRLYLVVFIVRHIGQGPTGIGQHLYILLVDQQLRQHRQQALHLVKGRRRILVAAQIRHQPNNVAEKRQRRLIID